MRSWLHIPAGNAARLDKAAALPADVMVVDFHAGPGEVTGETRAQAAAWLSEHGTSKAGFARWVRIRPVSAPQWREDLVAVMPSRPDGVVMTGVETPDDVRQLGSELYELEQRHGLAPNSMPLVLELGASARGALAIERMALDPHPRVFGVTWNPAMLARDIGSAHAPGKVGWPAPMAHVRAQTVLVAKALGALALEAAYPVWRDADAFERACALARRDGFDAMAAVHPAQLGPINDRFSPTEAERAEADIMVARFEESPSANVLSIAGRMVDRAQLARARRVLAMPC
ncbi:CoA ester lyase [Altererythrobacter sp. H2]|uniref:HpcH/HpaI aldolase/citrate lyase family protein n=1 Tax=Altererythrobacter sp. H2 TaxID=3108391 RepID=UPI002B4BEE1B|nr:CoA ester lyase [Altererythrobacter sp. H2]WRK95611.1 CoA ester lyase [Altererythrobacter sp. H2]